jgi:hypothetical protein
VVAVKHMIAVAAVVDAGGEGDRRNRRHAAAVLRGRERHDLAATRQRRVDRQHATGACRVVGIVDHRDRRRRGV